MIMIIRISIAVNCESVWCKIEVDKSNNLTIGVCYSSQAASNEELHELFNVTEKASLRNVSITGNLSYPNTNWDTLDYDSTSAEYRDSLLGRLIDLRPCQHDNGYMDGRSQIKVHTDERTQVHSAQSSLVIAHPGTNRARCFLTSVTESSSKHWSPLWTAILHDSYMYQYRQPTRQENILE